MATEEISTENNNTIKYEKSSNFHKPLWSDSEDEDDTESEKKVEKSRVDAESQEDTTKSGPEKSKDEKGLLGSEFDSKWDRFPTSQEFKSLYGEEIWEQLQNSYQDLAKSVTDSSEVTEEPQQKKDREKRTTCWDALETTSTSQSDVSTPSSKEPQETGEKKRMGRPPGIKNGERAPKGPGKVQCHMCENRFDSLAQARAHLIVHSGTKPYKCGQCEYKSYSKFNVTNNHWSNKHGRRGNNEDVVTDEAEKERIRLFVVKESEKMLPITDKRIHDEVNGDEKEERPEKKPRQKLDIGLKPERKNHKVTGQLICTHCDKAFETMVLVRGHLQVHADIKPYKCTKCDYKSYSKNNVINNHWSNNHGRKADDDDVEADMDEKLNLKRFVIEESEKIYNQMMEDKKRKESVPNKDTEDNANESLSENSKNEEEVSSKEPSTKIPESDSAPKKEEETNKDNDIVKSSEETKETLEDTQKNS